ncbi:MAG: VOC family protein [Paludibacteraceae bacterium]|nr:VOC family protein [Paludibacteraceae bacterium]
MRVHHIGIACSDIDEAIEELSKFHTILSRSETVFDPEQNASLCMVSTELGLDFEFISGEQVARLLKKGVSYYHLCYEVENLEAVIEKYIADGAMLISPAKPAVLFGGKRVAFLYVSYGLIELVEQ